MSSLSGTRKIARAGPATARTTARKKISIAEKPERQRTPLTTSNSFSKKKKKTGRVRRCQRRRSGRFSRHSPVSLRPWIEDARPVQHAAGCAEGKFAQKSFGDSVFFVFFFFPSRATRQEMAEREREPRSLFKSRSFFLTFSLSLSLSLSLLFSPLHHSRKNRSSSSAAPGTRASPPSASRRTR